jgi:DUF971 family protein
MNEKAPAPTEIRLRRKSRLLELSYGDGSRSQLPCEYLRVFSPSAEVQGHGPGQAVLMVGKENVNITAIEPVGHYAVRLRFDDGHDSGLFTWPYLHELASKQDENWQGYLKKLDEVGYKRRDATPSDAAG